MILYLDTSALVKLYVREGGSVTVRNLVKRADAVATSVIAYAETRAAFARLLRSASTSSRRHRERITQFNADWESYMRVELTGPIVRLAGESAEIYGLRGFDSVHLASALWLRDRTKIDTVFVAYDQRLRDGALSAGLVTFP